MELIKAPFFAYQTLFMTHRRPTFIEERYQVACRSHANAMQAKSHIKI
jgi:hypothetical protein